MNDSLFQRVKDHFLNPRNQGEIPDPDLVLEMGSIAEGNAVKLMLKLDDSKRIREAKIQSFGACESIAAFSILTELLIGKTADEVALITERDIFDWILGFPGIPMFETNRAVALLRQAWTEKKRTAPNDKNYIDTGSK